MTRAGRGAAEGRKRRILLTGLIWEMWNEGWIFRAAGNRKRTQVPWLELWLGWCRGLELVKEPRLALAV